MKIEVEKEQDGKSRMRRYKADGADIMANKGMNKEVLD